MEQSEVKPTVTGRRRCGIPEHRRQIRAMQRWGAYLQQSMARSWSQSRVVQLERDALQAEVYRLRRKLQERQAALMLAGMAIGFIMAALVAGAIGK